MLHSCSSSNDDGWRVQKQVETMQSNNGNKNIPVIAGDEEQQQFLSNQRKLRHSALMDDATVVTRMVLFDSESGFEV